MDSTDVLNSIFKNERQIFSSKLSSFTVLDIGTIVEVKDGRALVNGSSFVGGQQTIYKDAEIIYPGNEGGAFTAESAGTPCLIFIPMSCMINTGDRKVQVDSSSYNTDGVKVMPISNAAASLVRTCFSAGGVYSVITKNYNVSFSEDTITLERKDAQASFGMDYKGGLHVTKQGENSTHYLDMVDGTTTSTWQSKDKDVQWVDTLNSDGSRTLVQNNPQNEGADPTCSITIDKDGNVSVNGKTINLNGDDKRLVTYGELKDAMDKLWTAMTTTPIAGNGSSQPSWTGLPNGIDISASETQTIKTGG